MTVSLDDAPPLPVYDTLRDALALLRAAARPLLTIMAVYAAASLALALIAPTISLEDPEAPVPTGAILFDLALQFVIFAAGALAVAAAILVAAGAAQGRTVAPAEAAAAVAPRTPTVMAVQFFAALGVTAGLVLFVVPGVYLMALLSAAVPALVMEGLGFDALRRSVELTRGTRWQIAGALVAAILGVIVSTGVAIAVVAALAAALGVVGAVLLAVVEVAANALGLAFGAALSATIYLRLRAREDAVRGGAD